jgi:hypothetical protein
MALTASALEEAGLEQNKDADGEGPRDARGDRVGRQQRGGADRLPPRLQMWNPRDVASLRSAGTRLYPLGDG